MDNIYDPTTEPSSANLQDGQFWQWNAFVSPAAWCIRTTKDVEPSAWAWYLTRARERAEARAMATVYVVEVPLPPMPAPTGEPVNLPAPV